MLCARSSTEATARRVAGWKCVISIAAGLAGSDDDPLAHEARVFTAIILVRNRAAVAGRLCPRSPYPSSAGRRSMSDSEKFRDVAAGQTVCALSVGVIGLPGGGAGPAAGWAPPLREDLHRARRARGLPAGRRG